MEDFEATDFDEPASEPASCSNSGNGADGRAARLRAAALARFGGVRIVLEDLCDYGNRAAILRTVEAFGLLHVHEIVSPAVNGSRKKGDTARGRSIVNGAEKWLELHRHTSAADCVRELRDLGFQLLAAMPPNPASGSAIQAPVPLDAVDFGVQTALVFGSEAYGISSTMLTACHGSFTVPLPGLSESLNVSVAVAVCCHFARHSRSRALGLAPGQGDRQPEQVEELVASYMQRSGEPGFTAAVRCSRSLRGAGRGTSDDSEEPVEAGQS